MNIAVWATIAGTTVTLAIGLLSLRRARLGPTKRPAWRLDHARGHQYTLALDAAPARDVRIEVENGQLTSGQAEHAMFRPGQRAQLLITAGPERPTADAAERHVGRPFGAPRAWSSDVSS